MVSIEVGVVILIVFLVVTPMAILNYTPALQASAIVGLHGLLADKAAQNKATGSNQAGCIVSAKASKGSGDGSVSVSAEADYDTCNQQGNGHSGIDFLTVGANYPYTITDPCNGQTYTTYDYAFGYALYYLSNGKIEIACAYSPNLGPGGYSTSYPSVNGVSDVLVNTTAWSGTCSNPGVGSNCVASTAASSPKG